jgi:hypothetical protein
MASFEVRNEPAFDPDSRYGRTSGEPDPVDEKVHPFDTPEYRGAWLKLWSWWNEARDAHFNSRALRLRDHEMYDGRQWTDEEIAGLEARGQAPLVFNVLAQAVDWIVGTERRTRVDWNVLPRSDEDVETAGLKKELLKYISDVNKLGWQRSFAFKDSVISGLGLIEDCVVSAANEEPIHARYCDWKTFWWDPNSRDPQFRDARYLIRQKYLDVDYACAMFPERAGLIRLAAQTNLDPGLELLEDDAMISSLHMGSRSILSGSSALVTGGYRERVRIFEIWFRQPVHSKRLRSVWPVDDDPLHDIAFDPTNEEHVKAAESPIYTLTEGVTDEMMVAFITDGGLLDIKKSPYSHGRYPFTAFWAYRDHLTGMPYGIVRRAIDPQRDYNKRRSKALHLLLSNRVTYEEDAFVEGDEENQLEEIGRPDGQVRVRKGTIAGQKLQIDEHQDIVDGHLRLMEEDRTNIHESTGVTKDNVGQQSNAVSGRAIIAKQQQGAVTTAEIFDNYRLGMVESGEKSLCNVERFMTLPKVFRILGPDGEADWKRINDPVYNPATGQVEFENDITKHAADFVVDQQDYRETMRMALAESLFEMLGKLPPEAALNLLDIAVDLLDLPNKAALANRIRAINGQAAPGTENTDEAIVAREQREAARAQQEQLGIEDLQAGVRLKNAQASKAESESTATTVRGKREALDTAGIVSAALPLAPAADRLYDGSKPQPSLSRPAPEIEAAA